jgi:hypothetical protein
MWGNGVYEARDKGDMYGQTFSTSGAAIGPFNKVLNFNASRYNNVFGKASAVQPPAIQTLVAIRY